MNWETYIAYGDSITKGARTYFGYPELLGDSLGKVLSKQWNVVNHSDCGFKAIDLVRHIDKHFISLKECNSCISTILIGTNDIKENTNIEDFKIALKQIVLKVKLLTVNKNVLILAIPEFHKGIMYPYLIEMNENIKIYNTIIKEIAIQNSIRYIEVNHSETDFFDGVHLNRNGIENFSNQILKFILNDKGINLG